jgi:hypothetical protein
LVDKSKKPVAAKKQEEKGGTGSTMVLAANQKPQLKNLPAGKQQGKGTVVVESE